MLEEFEKAKNNPPPAEPSCLADSKSQFKYVINKIMTTAISGKRKRKATDETTFVEKGKKGKVEGTSASRQDLVVPTSPSSALGNYMESLLCIINIKAIFGARFHEKIMKILRSRKAVAQRQASSASAFAGPIPRGIMNLCNLSFHVLVL
ncbi:hypothetical protein L6452_08861 [Arctium lappa]|uniref:Uncharacterized protein n=1 Tax=Arctium lappa TaxID=4217 RepID=A0ACB9DIX4_ARCLA|nr:hypothetical protein L6452_08861 [Arctium lappa]